MPEKFSDKEIKKFEENAEEMMTEEQKEMSKSRGEAFTAGESKAETEESFSIEGGKVVEFMRSEMNRMIKYMEYVKSDR